MLAIPFFAFLAAGLSFEYDRKLPLDVKEIHREAREGAVVLDITFAALDRKPTAAYVVRPESGESHAGVLFVHWYEPPSGNSNRTQFLGEAVTLASRGVVSLLVETMWSDPKWFPSRNRAEDYENSVKQAKALRRALDVLMAQPGVDPRRIAYVGHDFGAMFGATLASVESRVKAWALQAGTVSFSDWYLLGPKMEGEARDKFIAQLAPLDPVKHIGRARAPVLLQFGTSDRFVSEAKSREFFAAAAEPKKALWYDAGHGLNEQAVKDRIEWLAPQLAPPRASYDIRRARGKIRIDGRLDEAAWKRARPVGDFHFNWWTAGAKEQTVAKMLWDDENLYVSWFCRDKHISASVTERHGPVSRDDCVEIFLSPNPDKVTNYYTFEINAIGTMLNRCRTDWWKGPPTWEPEGVNYRTTYYGQPRKEEAAGDESWVVELAIPLRNFAKDAAHMPPRNGDRWRLNLNRTGGVTDRQNSTWSPVAPPARGFHTPESFGDVRFVAAP
jgi:dienelactone hydrolase